MIELFDEIDRFRWVRSAELRAYNQVQFIVHHLADTPKLRKLYWLSLTDADRKAIQRLRKKTIRDGFHYVRRNVSIQTNGEPAQ